MVFGRFQFLSQMSSDEPIELFGQNIRPIPVFHGRSLINGYRLGDMAYLTDVSKIPDTSMEQLQKFRCPTARLFEK